MPRTKIVCTVGPASRAPEILRNMMEAGMSVARLNFSHGTHEEHGENIRSIRRIAEQLGRPVAVLQDLSGWKIRVGEIEEPGVVTLEPEARVVLTSRPVTGSAREVPVTYADLPRDVQPGDPLLLSDGALELEALETTDTDIVCRVVVGGPLSSHKGINLPTRSIRASGMTDKDKADFAFGIEQGVDLAALSFVRSVDDVNQARRFARERGGDVPLIAKIEKHEALANIDAIIAAVDGIMVARGDLGVEIPPQKVPGIQKTLIEKANRCGKPVITATHMLRSMVDNPRPTRAEVTDVANAVWDGTDAVMLSEETAIGKYPAKSVSMMAAVAEEAEGRFAYAEWMAKSDLAEDVDLDCAVARAACRLAEDIEAASIITCTQSGSTARNVSRFRPRRQIIAVTTLPEVQRRLCLSWGVHPLLVGERGDTDKMIGRAVQAALDAGLARRGEKVVITAGIPTGVPGTTNLIKVETL